jgi:hypothetical protein
MSTCTEFQVYLKKSYLAKYNDSERTVMLNIYLQRKNRLGTENLLFEIYWRHRILAINTKQNIRDINCVTRVAH